MRMDTDAPLSAADLVNRAEPDELVHILRAYGEEPRAPKVVRAILDARPDRDDGAARRRGALGRVLARGSEDAVAGVPGAPHRGQRRARRAGARARRRAAGAEDGRAARRHRVSLARRPPRQAVPPLRQLRGRARPRSLRQPPHAVGPRHAQADHGERRRDRREPPRPQRPPPHRQRSATPKRRGSARPIRIRNPLNAPGALRPAARS